MAQTDQFLCVKLRGSDPFARGVQYGQQAEALIRRAIEGYHRQFQKSVGQSWDAVVKRSHYYTDFVNEHYPEEFQEMLGIAEGSGVAVDEIMALNCRYEILKLKLQECTTGAILKEASGGKVYLLQNWDYRPWVERHAVIVDIDDLQGTHIIGVTEAGQLVRNGMNNHGIGLCANNLTSIYDSGDIGAPVTFVQRKALNSRCFQEMVDTVTSAKRGVSCNFMLASAENKAVDLETTPQKIYQVQPENGIVTHANHMIAGAAACTNQGTKFRDGVLRRLLQQGNGTLSFSDIREALCNHERFPGAGDTYPESNCIEAVCSHVPHGEYDECKVWKTIASSIYDLTDGVAYICKGCPCENEYQPFPL